MSFSVFVRGLAAFSILLPAAAYAQQQDEEEVVVTAPLEGSRIESLQGAEVLNRDDIIENLNGGLGDTLDATPGISTTFFGAGASRPIIRGLGDDRVRVLQNGIGAIDASTASPDHAVTSDGLDADRIEILRGAAALAYGGNAIGGVVNVIDQSIPTRPVDGATFEGLGAYSSVDDGTQGAASLAVGGGRFAVRVSGSVRNTHDYDIPGYAESAAARAAEEEEEEEGEEHEEAYGTAPNSWVDLRTLSIGGSMIDDNGFVGLAVKRTETDYGLPGHEHHHEEEEGEEEHHEEAGPFIGMEQTRIELRGDRRIDIGPFDRLDFGLQHSDYQHTEFEAPGEPGTRFFSEGVEGRVEAHHENGAHEGVTGVQYSSVDFEAQGDEAFITPTTTRDIGAFVVERWDWRAWGIEAGGRYEQREVDNDVGGVREFDNVSGSIGLFFRPAQNWFVGGTLAHTERAPTAFELFADGPHLATGNYELGNADLGQETALSFEASARYESDIARFEINLFRISFSDYIALVDRGDIWWSDEEGGGSGFAPDEDDPSVPEDAEVLPVFNFIQRDATFTGGEISASVRLFEAAGFAVRGDVAVDIVRAEFDDGGHPPRIPPMSSTVGLEAENGQWNGRIEVVDVQEQDRLAEFETPTDGYTFLNASLGFRPGGEGGAWMIRLDGRNLTDEEGRVHSSFLKDELPLPGRNVRLTVSTEF